MDRLCAAGLHLLCCDDGGGPFVVIVYRMPRYRPQSHLLHRPENDCGAAGGIPQKAKPPTGGTEVLPRGR